MKKQLLIALIGVIFCSLLAGCSSIKNPVLKEQDEKIPVCVSILPQRDFVEKVGGDRVRVTVMIPPGAEPGTYELSPGQLKQLAEAELYVKIGHVPFEKAWMNRMQSANKDMKVVDSSQSIELLDGNPHIWLSPRLVKIQAANICEALTEMDSEHEKYYTANLEAFNKELDSLDDEISQRFAKLGGQEFLVYHPAWDYFALDYGLKQLAIEHEGKEPGAMAMSQLVDYARDQGIATVFASPQHSLRSAQAIAAELGGEVVELDPLPQKYIEGLREASTILARELSK